MDSRALRPWPVALLGLNLTVAVGSVVLSLRHEAVFDTVFYAINAAALGATGFLVTCFRPGHRIGLLLTGLGVEAGLVELAEGYGYHRAWPGATDSSWVSVWASYIGIGAIVVLPAVFPDGRSVSPRWRPVVWSGVAGIVLSTVGTAFSHEFGDRYPGRVNPHAVAGDLPDVAVIAGEIGLVVALVGAVASMVARFRRSGPERRLQLKWLVYVLALLAVIGPFALFLYDRSVLVQWAIAVTVTLIPIAMGIGILRYRLYDIDVIISRTVVYAALSAVLTAAWLAASWLLGLAVAGRHPAWVTVTATVAACALVLPARGRLQEYVDRRFRRARHDALSRIDAHLEALRTGQAAAEDLEPLLQDVLGRPDLHLHYVLPDAQPRDEGTRTRTTVRRAGIDLAIVEHCGPAPLLLGDVLERAGLAIEIARLRAEVAHQLAEVNRSRDRLVAAGYEERRRLERDLHDGAQQRLVTVGLELRHAQHELGPSPVASSLEQTVQQVASAINELREIARGVRPFGLDHGLGVALRELVTRTPIAVELTVDPDRFAADLEAAAYFVASEAVTNAVKHSRASAIRLRVGRSDSHLMLCVSDDGIGGADPSNGSGLRGLDDRVAAHGGELHLASTPGTGTTLTARLPCGS